MFFSQVVHPDLGCASYIVASSESCECVVVDPRWEIEPYLTTAAEHGFRITRIVETHTHADHVSGHGRLAKSTGAEICIHESAGVEYPHRPLHDGEVIDLGDVRLHVIHTPGHRPEHVSLAIEDVSRGADPWILLTGDSLFVGDVARPDLAVAGQEGASLLFHSLHAKLLALPEFAAVYPAHVAGSLCGRVESNVSSTTLGYEKRYNSALAIETEAEFVEYMNAGLPSRPPNMERIVAANRGPLLTEDRRPERLTVEQARQAVDKGSIILDVRDADRYLEAHPTGAIHVALSGPQFGTRAGFVLPPETDFVLMVTGEDEAEHASQSLRVVSFDRVSGYVPFQDWTASGAPVTTMDRLSVQELESRLRDGDLVRVVDVREPDEWASGTVPEAVVVPYRDLSWRNPDVPRSATVAVMCGSGGRSAIGASLLERAGYRSVANVEGGMSAWKAAGFEVVPRNVGPRGVRQKSLIEA